MQNTIDALSTIGSGQKNVTTAGTQLVLAGNVKCGTVVIKALAANTGKIYVGDSTVSSTTGFILDAGETISFDIDNLSDIYIDSSVNGEGVSYVYLA